MIILMSVLYWMCHFLTFFLLLGGGGGGGGGIDLQDLIVAYIAGYLKKTFDKHVTCFDIQTQSGGALQSDSTFLFIKHKMYKNLSSKR